MTTFLRSAIANWRTTASGALVLVGLVSILGPLLGVPAAVCHACLAVSILAGAAGLNLDAAVGAADAARGQGAAVVSTGLDPADLADWLAWSKPFEGRVRWIYADVKGLCTTGVGNLLVSADVACELPWRFMDDGSWAPEGLVRREWDRVKAMPPGLAAARYRGAIYLEDSDIDALVGKQLAANDAVLRRIFPDYDAWPAEARKGTRSLAWAAGAGLDHGWPHFTAAARAQDWATCARESAIPSNLPRTEAQRALFEQAAAS